MKFLALPVIAFAAAAAAQQPPPAQTQLAINPPAEVTAGLKQQATALQALGPKEGKGSDGL